ncbi:MAG TPA: hypothetical protein VKK19_08695 [Candidatus Dormibacteraeota bacterium]|nr:hypothetical protein [Candidatus Dormibacteraeota bacterium]
MPIDNDFKRLVRARMAATGETHTAARAALSPTTPRLDRQALVSRLVDPASAASAASLLTTQPPERLVPALVGE